MISEKKISESERNLMLIAELAGRKEAPEFEKLIAETSYTDEEKDEYLQKMKPYIRQGLRQRQKAGIITMTMRIAKSAAIAFIVLAVLFGFTYVTVEAFRVSVSNFFKIENQTYMTIDSHDGDLLPEGWTGYALGKIPGGFYLESWTLTKSKQTLSYRDKNGAWIELTQYEKDRALKIDSENKTIDEVEVNSFGGYYIWDNIIGKIYLYMDHNNITITSTLPKDELFDVVKSVIYIE